MRILVIFAVLFFQQVPIVIAQDLSVEELRTEIEKTREDTSRIKLLTDLAEKLADKGEVRAAGKSLAKAETMSDSLNYSYGRQLVYLNRANLYLIKNQPDSARQVLETALRKYPESTLRRSYYNYLGTAFRFLGKNEAALEYYNKAVALSDTTRDVHALVAVKQNMAVVYQNMGQRAQAMQHYLEGLKYAESVRDTMFLATLVNNIGEAYTDYEEYDKAEHYLQRSLELSHAIGFKVGLLRASLNMANVKSSIGEFDTALDLYRQALDLSEKIRPGRPPVRIYHNLGKLYHNMGDAEKAEEYLKESLSQSTAMGVVMGIYYNSTELGKIAFEEKRVEEAIGWYKQAYSAAVELKSVPFQMEVNEKLFELNKDQKNYRESLKYLEALYSMSDSLRQLEKDQALAEYEAKLNVHRQEQINQLLRAKQSEQEARLRVQRWLIIAGFLVIILVFIIVAILAKVNKEKKISNRKLKEQKRELEQLNEVKNKLFAVVAHDLRSPLTGLQGMLYLLRDNSMSGEELRALFAQLEVSMLQNMNIMENLLIWARQQMEGITVNAEIMHAKPIVDEITDSYQFYAQQKGIQLINKVPEDIEVLADPDLMELVLRNLISNSLKFSKEGDYVAIYAASRDDSVLFTVEDTGIGIPEPQKKAIFQAGNKTRRGTNNEHGSGLGLNLCKEFIEKQQGNMSFESEEGKGTLFYFSLPAAN